MDSNSATAPTAVFNVSPPSVFDVDSEDINEAWSDFKTEFEIFSELAQLARQPESMRKATFLSCIGLHARKWIKGLGVDIRTSSETAIEEKIEEKCARKKSKTMLDFKFWSADLDQRDGETFDSYAARVRNLASTCK